MSQVLDFRSVAPSRRRRDDARVRSLPNQADPNNAPGRVLSEMFVVLTVATLVACTLTWLAPALA